MATQYPVLSIFIDTRSIAFIDEIISERIHNYLYVHQMSDINKHILYQYTSSFAKVCINTWQQNIHNIQDLKDFVEYYGSFNASNIFKFDVIIRLSISNKIIT